MRDHPFDVAPAPNTRRKVLRAAFVAPVITAVSSGSALAASSATCFARQIASPRFPGVGAQDNYLRIQLGKLVSGSATTYYVDGSTIQALRQTPPPAQNPVSTSYTLTTGQFQEFNKITNSETANVLPSQPSGGTYTQASGEWAVLRFGSDGKMVGVGSSGLGSAVTGSCLASLTP